jgi:hypothetical protein
MTTLRYNYLRSVIRKLELETQTADAIAARILNNGDISALTSFDVQQLGQAVQTSAMLAHEAAIQLPQVAEVRYE